MYLLGGNGNDIIYNPYLRYGTTVASGGGDKDIIRFDTYDSVDNYQSDNSPVYIFGDWGYGPEDDPFILD